MGAALRLLACPTAASVMKGRSANWSHRRDWSALPEPALLSIAMYLTCSLADVLAFGRVCKAWRTVARDNDRVLMSSLPPMLFRDDTAGFYCPADGRLYRNAPLTATLLTGDGLSPVCGYSFGHLVLDNHLDGVSPRTFSVVNPLTGTCICQFPTESRDAPTWAVLSAPPASQAGCVLWTSDGRRVKSCRLGDSKWTTHPLDLEHDAWPPVFVENESFRSSLFTRALELRLVRGQWSRRILEFHVYRVDVADGTRVRLRSLGNRALFWDSFGFTVAKNPGRWGGARDCVYFVDEEDEMMGVFHLQDARMEFTARVYPSEPKFRLKYLTNFAWIHPSMCY